MARLLAAMRRSLASKMCEVEETFVRGQALLEDLQESPAGRLCELQGQRMPLLDVFLETVEPAPMASASNAQVDQLQARHD